MIEIFRLLQLLVSIVLASQGIFYLLGLAGAVRDISIPAFAEQRNAIDKHIAGKLKILYYSALSLGVLTMILMKDDYGSWPFLCVALSTAFTAIDMLLAVKYNIPINKAFKSYPGSSQNWNDLRARWLRFILVRGCFSIGAMLLLQGGLVAN